MKVVFAGKIYFFRLICSLIHMKGRRQRGQCRVSWLTNSALVYEPIYRGKGGGVRGVPPTISNSVRNLF